jgi:predicted RNA-binding Zn-ribbon protein involved in translation (DUF1610 family)
MAREVRIDNMDLCPSCGMVVSEDAVLCRCPICGEDGYDECCFPTGQGVVCPDCEMPLDEDTGVEPFWDD